MALSDKEISALYFEALGAQHLREQDRKTVARFACAVESEVQKQDEALIRLMHGALVSLAQWMVAEVEHFDGATPDAWIIDGVNAALAASRARLESKL